MNFKKLLSLTCTIFLISSTAAKAEGRNFFEHFKPQRGSTFFSYVSCANADGSKNYYYMASGEGIVPIEAEANAIKAAYNEYRCNYGTRTLDTQVINLNKPEKYCIAACLDHRGNPLLSYSVGVRARNKAEASYLAIKKVINDYKCNYSAEVTACQ